MYEKNSTTSELLKRTGLIVAISSMALATAEELPAGEIDKATPAPLEAVAFASVDTPNLEAPEITNFRSHPSIEPKKYWYGAPEELKVIKQLGNTANAKLTFIMAKEQPWFSARQMYCIDKLWYRESKFGEKAGHPGHAYGIPQANPGYKMSSAGKNWMDSSTTQIKWGFDYYIEDVYKTPCGAWAHSRVYGVY